ncbi:uncharacterized protein LOC101238613 [Trichonephila clavipes]|uniref:Uncharacterized protein LOC101238613, partial n=1 Tax=Trichonephila clavipes TaxID=2585209 RepID=A0A8X7BH94_TRICX|nr:uncharacterized protein LOC101238613 [Trichonephila clavipes]
MAKSRSGRSKKRRFTGNRYTIRATINENDETSELNSTESASAKSWNQAIQVWKFSQKDCLKLLKTIELFPYDREDERFLSYKLFNCFGAKDNRERIFSWQKLCAFLGLPFLSKLAFRNQERKLLKATERVAQENINAALSEIKGSNSFTKCGISIDGTWQRRGYSSLNGCCPEGSESWCRYQRAKAAGSPLKEIEQGLPNKIINQIKPTYLKLCNETLLKKCLHGKTQNCNESYNNILWNIVPKNIFIGLETFRLGALLALILYNSGYAGILSVIRNVNGSLPESVAQELLKFDKQRISTYLRHSLPIAKLSRKKKEKQLEKQKVLRMKKQKA